MKKKAKQSRRKQEVIMFIPISYLEGTWKGELRKLPPNKVFELVVDYPLVYPVSFDIRTGKSGMGLIALINKIGKVYETIYNDPDKYGVRNHGIDDLSLQSIEVDFKRKKIELCIGS